MCSPEERRDVVNEIFKRIKSRLDELDEIRHQLLTDQRDLLSSCRKAMNFIHSGNVSEAKKIVTEVRKRIQKVKHISSDAEMFCLISNILRPVKQELVEVEVLLSIIECQKVPSPEDLGVDVISHTLGLADVIGELRREVLIAIGKNNLSLARQFLEWMRLLFEEISQLTYPDSLIPIRHKTDVGRSLLDRTLSEFLFYKRSSFLLK